MTDPVSLSPLSFEEPRLCDLCLEDALVEGGKLSKGLKPDEWRETSVRFCIDGLYKWYKSFSQDKCSVFSLVRDLSWHWMSYCCYDPTLSQLRREYSVLLREITEGTAYTDLAERMDAPYRFTRVGYRSRFSFNVVIPREASGVLTDTAVAVGMSFSVFLQVGLAWSLSTNRQGIYRPWVEAVFEPLFDEVIVASRERLKTFREIRVLLQHRGQG